MCVLAPKASIVACFSLNRAPIMMLFPKPQRSKAAVARQFGFISQPVPSRPLELLPRPLHGEVMLLARHCFNAPFAQLIWRRPE